MTSAALLAQVWIILHCPELQAASARGTLTVIPALVSTALLVVALIVTIAVPAIGLWALLILLLVDPVQNVRAAESTRTKTVHYLGTLPCASQQCSHGIPRIAHRRLPARFFRQCECSQVARPQHSGPISV